MNSIDFSSYRSVVEWLFLQLPMYQKQGKSAFKKDLKNIIALCDVLGNPQEEYKCIHIAGTNGKGTTAHLMAAGLSKNGLKVGLYTSPHYKDYRERVKVNGSLMTKSFVKSFVKNNFKEIQRIEPSFFEITVAMAFQYFKEQNVDIAIIETGLGGRLDSTNIISPILSLITNISLDHEAMLGNTIEAIAMEKAGIIKSKTPVLIGEKSPMSDDVFIKKAKEQNADLTFVQENIEVNNNNKLITDNSYEVIFGNKVNVYSSDLYGAYQKYNIATAIYSLQFLSEYKLINGFKWRMKDVPFMLNGLKESWKYMGRFQVLGQSPLVIADSAHNKAGLASVMGTLSQLDFDQLHIIIGFVNDKTLDEILGYFPKQAKYYFVKADIPRALSAKQLEIKAKTYQLIGKSYTSVKSGFAAAKKSASKNDVVYLGGSIFVLAEIL